MDIDGDRLGLALRNHFHPPVAELPFESVERRHRFRVNPVGLEDDGFASRAGTSIGYSSLPNRRYGIRTVPARTRGKRARNAAWFAWPRFRVP